MLMRVERSRGRGALALWHQGRMGPLQFDGYEVCIHFTDESGRDVRVTFERAEAEALEGFIAAELKKQRERVAALTHADAELEE